MQPGDLVVVAFVNDQPVGMQFRDWPLHVTVLSWLRGNVDAQKFAERLENSLANIGEFEVEVAGEANFGPDGSVLINLIRQPTEFGRVFEKSGQAANKAGFHQVSKRYPTYRPHVTVQKHDRAHKGDTFSCGRLHVVKQRGDHKEIVAVVRLGYGQKKA